MNRYKLEEICDFYAGTGFPTMYQGNQEGKYPFYKVGDISKNALAGYSELTLCDNYIDDDVLTKIKGNVLPPHTIVFAKIGEALKLNRRGLTTHYCLVDNNVMGISPHQELDYKYFYHFMKTVKMQDYSNATTLPAVKKSEVGKIEINVPSLPEQQKIAAHLDSIQSAIDNKKQQLSELDELVKSKFVEMFGDISTNSKNFELLEFNEICTSLKSGLSRKLSDEDIGLPVIRSINIKNGEFVKAPIKYWYRNDPQKANTEDYFLRTNDILVNFINSTSQIGKCCIYQDIGRDCIYTTNIFSMRLDKKCEPIYFNSYAQTDYYFKQIETITQGAVNQASFTTKNFLKLKMPVPPIELQNDFATFVQKIDTAKSIIKTQLADLQELLDSKMDEYFGENK